MLLYEVDRVCRRYPGAGTPTQYLGLDRYFSDSVCTVVDFGIAEFGEWVDGRSQQRQKVGRKGKTKPVYDTLADVLGITEAQARAGKSGKEFSQLAGGYLQATIAARKDGAQGPPCPPGIDPELWARLQQQRAELLGQVSKE